MRVHRERPFLNDLVNFMISGPVMIQVLEGESAIAKNRELMGATDPKKADKGTIRADFADSIDANAVHGSDGPETAARRDRLLLSRARHLPVARSRDAPPIACQPAGFRSPDGLAAWFAELGEKPFRARQLMRWIHQRGEATSAR